MSQHPIKWLINVKHRLWPFFLCSPPSAARQNSKDSTRKFLPGSTVWCLGIFLIFFPFFSPQNTAFFKALYFYGYSIPTFQLLVCLWCIRFRQSKFYNVAVTLSRPLGLSGRKKPQWFFGGGFFFLLWWIITSKEK